MRLIGFVVASLLVCGTAFGQVAKVKSIDLTVKEGFSGEADAAYSSQTGDTEYSLFSADVGARYKFQSKDFFMLSFGRTEGIRGEEKFADENHENVQFTKDLTIFDVGFGLDFFVQRDQDFFDAYESHMFYGAGPHVALFDNGLGNNLTVGAAYVYETYSFKSEPKKELDQENVLVYAHANAKLTDKLSVGQNITLQEKIDKDSLKFNTYFVDSESFIKVALIPNVAAKFSYDALYVKAPEVTFEKVKSSLKTGVEVKL